jgi:hypothetical protein
MTRHLHLPHPHIADRFIESFGEGWFSRMFLHETGPVIVPDGHDWEPYRWGDGPGYAEYTDGAP